MTLPEQRAGRFLSVLFCVSGLAFQATAAEPYLEPGSLRLSHTLNLEGVFHKASNGYHVADDGLNKLFNREDNRKNAWKSEWGESLLTEAAARVTPDIFGRVLFEAQGEYADRFFRPINIEHRTKAEDNNLILREAEGRIDRDDWYLHGFTGVAHGDWVDKGDIFGLYPSAYPTRDYLGSSGFFGVYPANWRQDQYLNIGNTHSPRGAELGGNFYGFDGDIAYGNELVWGFRGSLYGRVATPIATSKLTFAFKDEDVPYTFNHNDDERNRAYSLGWSLPTEQAALNAGVLYEPFRVGQFYTSASEASGGSGIQGSSWNISQKKTKKSDALGEKLQYQRTSELFRHVWIWSLDLTRLGILAGNKQQLGATVGSDVTPTVKGNVQYVYRKPIEGPVPFLYEGTPENIGNIVSNPRGPESPFWVNWTNREAVFVVTTFQYDPTPGTNMFMADPSALALWNLNPEENSRLCLAVQHRASDYRTATDRQYYHNANGDIVWEPASHSGAWATKHTLHEVRLLAHGTDGGWKWTLGLAGGQMLAVSGLAYSTSTDHTKPITEYVSLEWRLDHWPWAIWGNYGTGVWGPEENIHPYFGESYDRLYGLGVSYNITRNTTWDLNYIGARQDALFYAPSLGSFDEIRTVFSHRFGFIFQFENPSRSGTIAR